MKRIGWEDIEGMTRVRWRRLEDVSELLGGRKTPVSRNDLIFDIRSKEDAEGERRIIGSRRRVGFFWREETRGACEGAGVGRERRNVAAILRYGEKSWNYRLAMDSCDG
jgi:hypothetical protein